MAVTYSSKRLVKGAIFFAAVSLLMSCGLPRSGPSKGEIFAGSVLQEGDAFVITVDNSVNQIASVTPALGFSKKFLETKRLGADQISSGDILGVTIWENVENGLLAAQGRKSTLLEQVQVDGSGYIFIPYAGRIKAAGNTPEAIRRTIRKKLEGQTPDPQVEVRRVQGQGASVSIAGSVTGQGVYPIEARTRTLATMIAAAGGTSIPSEIAQVRVVRGNQTETIWFQDLYNNPGNDIAIRAGDRIFIERDTRIFSALGATGAQTRVPFESQTISAVEAIAQVGGLNSVLADPTGVFVFRNEPAEIANQLTGRTDLVGAQRIIYLLDLTKPNGIFMARDFAIRDQDTVYVTEAPYSQFNKVIAAATGSLGIVTTANSVRNAVQGN